MTILLTFNSKSHYRLLGCGIDSESIDRFTKYENQLAPLPHIFSTREIEHINTLEDKALGFCASFCCKEAFYKASGFSFNFPESEFFYTPGKEDSFDVSLPNHCSQPYIDIEVRLLLQVPNEITVLIYLFGEKE